MFPRPICGAAPQHKNQTQIDQYPQMHTTVLVSGGTSIAFSLTTWSLGNTAPDPVNITPPIICCSSSFQDYYLTYDLSSSWPPLACLLVYVCVCLSVCVPTCLRPVPCLGRLWCPRESLMLSLSPVNHCSACNRITAGV